MGDRIRKWIAVLLAGSILAMIQLVPAGGAVFVRENIENTVPYNRICRVGIISEV